MPERPRQTEMSVRDRLDALLANEELDPRIAFAVREVSNDLRDKNRYPTYYEEVLVMLLQDPEETVSRVKMEGLYTNPDKNTNRIQAVYNLLGRLDDKLKSVCGDQDFVVEKETIPSFRLIARQKESPGE